MNWYDFISAKSGSYKVHSEVISAKVNFTKKLQSACKHIIDYLHSFALSDGVCYDCMLAYKNKNKAYLASLIFGNSLKYVIKNP